jgi:hypothetical protein
MPHLVELDPRQWDIIPFVLVSVAVTITLFSCLLFYRKHERVVFFISYYIVFLKYLFIGLTILLLFTATIPAAGPFLLIAFQDDPSNLSTLAFFMWLSSVLYFGLFYMIFSHQVFLEASILLTLFLLLNSLIIILRYNKQHAEIRDAMRFLAAFQGIATDNLARESIPTPVEQDSVLPYRVHIPNIPVSSATHPILQQAIENEPTVNTATYGSLAR